MMTPLTRNWLRRLLMCFVWLGVGLVVALVLVREYVDWSGRRRWAAAQEMLAREGESLDFRKVAPEAVPDDQNFCAIPALKDLALISEDVDPKIPQGIKRNRLLDAALPDRNSDVPSDLRKGANFNAFLRWEEKNAASQRYVPRPKLTDGVTLGKATDMVAWGSWLRGEGALPRPGDPAKDVLGALSRDDSIVAELAAGLDRPDSQWTPAWRDRLMPEVSFVDLFPHYPVTQKLTTMLCLRGMAAGRVGDVQKAYQSLLIALRLNQADSRDPFFISALVAATNSAIISSAVWELCDAHAGSAKDFRKLQEALLQVDYQKSLLMTDRSELVSSTKISEYLKLTRDPASAYNSSAGAYWQPTGREKEMMLLVAHLLPDGLYDATAATFAELYLEYRIEPLRDGALKAVVAKQNELMEHVAEYEQQLPYRHIEEYVALVAMPASTGVVNRAIYAQCIVNEAIAGCALERYRIEHNSYPDTLEAADRAGERAIPLDVISGKPMGYRRTADGRYAVWCVGFDGKDDGGKRGPTVNKEGNVALSGSNYVGDWVWDFAGR